MLSSSVMFFYIISAIFRTFKYHTCMSNSNGDVLIHWIDSFSWTSRTDSHMWGVISFFNSRFCSCRQWILFSYLTLQPCSDIKCLECLSIRNGNVSALWVFSVRWTVRADSHCEMWDDSLWWVVFSFYNFYF